MNLQTSKERSEIMRKVGRKDTGPELLVRKELHKRGFRFRVNVKRLPGSPDIVLAKYKAVVFVHGCFWHRHEACGLASTPKSNMDFWNTKFLNNVERDQRKRKELENLGWKVLYVWQCELKKSQIQETMDRLAIELVK